MTTPAPSSTAPSGQPQGDPGNQPGQQPPVPPAPTAPQQPAPAPEATPATPAAPAPAPAPVPAPAEQPPAPAPAVEGDVSRLPQWAQRAITESQAAARTAAVQTAVYRAAPAAGADPLALLDSVSFRAAAEAIDPTDTAALTAAITAAVTANPRLGTAAPQGPARGGAEFSSPLAGDKRPATLADAIAARYSN